MGAGLRPLGSAGWSRALCGGGHLPATLRPLGVRSLVGVRVSLRVQMARTVLVGDNSEYGDCPFADSWGKYPFAEGKAWIFFLN